VQFESPQAKALPVNISSEERMIRIRASLQRCRLMPPENTRLQPPACARDRQHLKPGSCALHFGLPEGIP
jgi:hypothetical protein